MTLAANAQTAPRVMDAAQFIAAIRKWLATNVQAAVISAVLGAITGFVLHFALRVLAAHQATRPGGHNPLGGLLQSSLVCGLASSLVFGLVGYWRAVGSKKFFSDLGNAPNILAMLLRRDGASARVHLLWGAAVSLVAAQVISPWLGAAVATGILSVGPTALGKMISSLISRVWSSFLQSIAPTRRHAVQRPVSVMVGLLGSAAALFAGALIHSGSIKLGLAMGCAALAFVLAAGGGARARTGAVLLLCGGSGLFLYELLHPALAFAQCHGAAATPDVFRNPLEGAPQASPPPPHEPAAAAPTPEPQPAPAPAPAPPPEAEPSQAAPPSEASAPTPAPALGGDGPAPAPAPFEPSVAPTPLAGSPGPTPADLIAQGTPPAVVAGLAAPLALGIGQLLGQMPGAGWAGDDGGFDPMPDPSALGGPEELWPAAPVAGPEDLLRPAAPKTAPEDLDGDLADPKTAAKAPRSFDPPTDGDDLDDLPDLLRDDPLTREAATDDPEPDNARKRDQLAQLLASLGDGDGDDPSRQWLRGYLNRLSDHPWNVDMELLGRQVNLYLQDGAALQPPRVLGQDSEGNEILDPNHPWVRAQQEYEADALRGMGNDVLRAGDKALQFGHDLWDPFRDDDSTRRTMGRVQAIDDTGAAIQDLGESAWEHMKRRDSIHKGANDIAKAQSEFQAVDDTAKDVVKDISDLNSTDARKSWDAGNSLADTGEDLGRAFLGDHLFNAMDPKRPVEDRLTEYAKAAPTVAAAVDGAAGLTEAGGKAVMEGLGRGAGKEALETGLGTVEKSVGDGAATANGSSGQTLRDGQLNDTIGADRVRRTGDNVRNWDVPQDQVSALNDAVQQADRSAAAASAADGAAQTLARSARQVADDAAQQFPNRPDYVADLEQKAQDAEAAAQRTETTRLQAEANEMQTRDDAKKEYTDQLNARASQRPLIGDSGPVRVVDPVTNEQQLILDAQGNPPRLDPNVEAPPNAAVDPTRAAEHDAVATLMRKKQELGQAEFALQNGPAEVERLQNKYNASQDLDDYTKLEEARGDLTAARQNISQLRQDVPNAQAAVDTARQARIDASAPRTERIAQTRLDEAADAQAQSQQATGKFQQAASDWEANPTQDKADAAYAAKSEMMDKKAAADAAVARAATAPADIAQAQSDIQAQKLADAARRDDLENLIRTEQGVPPNRPAQEFTRVADQTELTYNDRQQPIDKRITEMQQPERTSARITGEDGQPYVFPPVEVAVDPAKMASKGLDLTGASTCIQPDELRLAGTNSGDVVGFNRDPPGAPTSQSFSIDGRDLTDLHEISHGLSNPALKAAGRNVVEGFNEYMTRDTARRSPSLVPLLASRDAYQQQTEWAQNLANAVGHDAIRVAQYGGPAELDALHSKIGASLGMPTPSLAADGKDALQQMNSMMSQGRFTKVNQAVGLMQPVAGETADQAVARMAQARKTLGLR